MKYPILFLLLLFIALFSTCDIDTSSSPEEFKVIWSNNGKSSSKFYSEDNVPESYYKYWVAKSVFDDLVKAKGNLGMLEPKFLMTDSEKSAATFNPTTVEVVLEEKAYDICTSFGKDSLNTLACLLAHELTHYYEKHGFSSSFAKDNPGMDTMSFTNTRFKITALVLKEMQADYLGGMLAFVAGYDPYNMMTNFLKEVYRAYDLDEQIAGYPSLTIRIQHAELAQKKLADLVNAFDAANYLTALGKYEAAKAYYEYIIPYYNSREIFNNLGVMSCLAALDYFTKEEMPFAIPLELDVDARLRKHSRGTLPLSERKKKREGLLKDAIKYLKQASIVDPSYAVTHLNLGCVYLLLGDSRKARFNAEEVELLERKRPSPNWQTISDSFVLAGVLAALEKDQIGAEMNFQEASKIDDNPLAQLNLNVIDKGIAILPASKQGLKEQSVQEEKIEGISLIEFANGISSDTDHTINRDIQLFVKEFDHSKIFIHAKEDDVIALLHLTDSRYNLSTAQGIQINEKKSALLKRYDVPEKEINLASGQMLVYPEHRLIFSLDKNKRVRGWCIYYLAE